MAKINWIQVNGKPLETGHINEVTVSLGANHQIRFTRSKSDSVMLDMSCTGQGVRFEVGNKVPTELEKVIKALGELFPKNKVG